MEKFSGARECLWVNWKEEEDEKLLEYMQAHDTNSVNWDDVPKAAGISRSASNCYARWQSLQPSAEPVDFTEEEEKVLMKLHAALGERWSLIAYCIGSKTYMDIKNHWGSVHMQEKIKNQGKAIDFLGLDSSDDSTSTDLSLNASLEHVEAAMFEDNQTTYALGEVDLELKL